MSASNTGIPKTEMDENCQQVKAAVSNAKKYMDDLQKLGLGIKQHEDKISHLRTQKNSLDDSILDLQVTIGKYNASIKPVTEEVDAQSEDETYKNILKLEKSAAGLICQLRTPHGSQVSHGPLMKDVLGIVATLGKVNDENLSWLLAEYLGKETMLTIVCKTFDGVQAMESYDSEGAINRNHGLHMLGLSLGCTIDGRFPVICLAGIRPYVGEFIANDPQRRLDLLKPKLLGGEIPRGFLGYAVNLIHIDTANLNLTTSGLGLRETLFYHLFSHLQVYRTREDMLQALPFISDGALSLDGGIIRSPAVFYLGNREEVEVKFPSISKKSSLADEAAEVMFPSISKKSSLPGNYYEIENNLQMKKWEMERLVEDIRREKSMLTQAKFSLEIKKKEYLRFLAKGGCGGSHPARSSHPP